MHHHQHHHHHIHTTWPTIQWVFLDSSISSTSLTSWWKSSLKLNIFFSDRYPHLNFQTRCVIITVSFSLFLSQDSENLNVWLNSISYQTIFTLAWHILQICVSFKGWWGQNSFYGFTAWSLPNVASPLFLLKCDLKLLSNQAT